MPTKTVAMKAMPSSVSAWQQSLEPSSFVFDPDRLATDLYQSCCQLLVALVRNPSPAPKVSLQHRLRAQAQKLKLWGSDHTADEGRLDVLLRGADRLKTRGLSLERKLSDLCLRLQSLKLQASEAIPQQDNEDIDAAVLDELSSFGSETSSHDEAEELEELVKDVHFQIDCLYGLGSVLQNSAEEVGKDTFTATQENLNQTYLNSIARPYVANIIDAYPSIDKGFAQRLGEANERRYKRLLDSRNDAMAAEDDSEHGSSNDDREEDARPAPGRSLVESTASESTAPSTQLSSLFDQNHRKPRPKATESVTSFASSVDDPSVQRRTRGIPKMPEDRPWGQPFKCTVCGEKLSTVWSTAQWVKHVYRDLQPYICTFGDTCSQAHRTFTSRHQWADHEFSEHRHGKPLQHDVHQISQEQCPFCLTCPATTRAQFVSHVGRHMQDISQAAIPMSALTGDQEELEVSDEDESERQSESDIELKAGPEPPFIVPPGFRANAFFVGLEKELQQLDEYFFKTARDFGTVPVVLFGPPGIGKTQLARQFVFENRSEYMGGVFWTSASSEEEIKNFSWHIQKTLVDTDATEHDHQVVKKWLEGRQHWLFVLDNVGLEVNLYNYVPEESLGSDVIYTTRDESLMSSLRDYGLYGLRRLSSIRISPLSEEESTDLLFQELRLTSPKEAEKRKAVDVVREADYLPLAIHAVCRKLSITQQPLAKYRLRDTIRKDTSSPYREVLEDLQKHHAAAWSLFAVLCWFANEVPIAMVRLGYNIVYDQHTDRVSNFSRPSREKSVEIRSSLDILRKYALIPDSEPDNETSEEKISLGDPLSQIMYGKCIEIHSVVRREARDLQSENAYESIEHAAQVLNDSYYRARDEVESATGWEARLGAYQKYDIQAQNLVENAEVFVMEPGPAARTKDMLQKILSSIKNDMWEIHVKTTTHGPLAGQGIGSLVQDTDPGSRSSKQPSPNNSFKERIDRPGLLEISAPPANVGAEVDIIFINGIYSDPQSTWTSGKSKVFWPADFLPPFVKEEKARIMTYGWYPADIPSTRNSTTWNAAKRLVYDLWGMRKEANALERPIVFVAHSSGGIVLKEALVYAQNLPQGDQDFRPIFISTFGILFLSTPHHSPSMRFSTFINKFFKDRWSTEIFTGFTYQEFAPLMSRYHISCFWENQFTDFDGKLLPIVDEDSAAPIIDGVERAAINADHMHMCKFESEASPGFDVVVEAIQRYAEEAPAIIRQRWKTELQTRENIRTDFGRRDEPLGVESFKLSESVAPESAHVHRPTPDELALAERGASDSDNDQHDGSPSRGLSSSPESHDSEVENGRPDDFHENLIRRSTEEADEYDLTQASREEGEQSPPLNQYWINGENIHREVLQTEICKILGPEAYFRPSFYNNGVPGFSVTAVRPFTPDQLDDLIELSSDFVQENRAVIQKGDQAITYRESQTSRRYNGLGTLRQDLGEKSSTTRASSAIM